MTESMKARFRATQWEETPLEMLGESAKRTRASVRQTYAGDIDGESVLEYLMVYRADGSASFVGMECIEGTVCGRAGSFVLRHEGEFADGVARLSLTIMAGAGTGELGQLRGGGRFESAHAEEYELCLECTWETDSKP
ncbi:MAG: DUF3224 domain-containing protein [Planctomycetota bacterium]